jgi:NAD(P)H-nitrite reductase large subunit
MIAIIGAGPAGIVAAETIRKFSEEEITIFSAEKAPPYNPAVLTTYLKTSTEDVFWKGKDVLERLKLDARVGEAVKKLEIKESVIHTDKGEYAYEKLIIASGSRLYTPLKGLNYPNIYNFKSIMQVERLKKSVKKGQKAVVIGAGFQGTEISLALSEMGVDVTLIEATDRIMPDRLDKKTSAFIEEVMEERGVKVVFNKPGKEFEGNGLCRAVIAEDGEVFEGDFFVAATGMSPNVDFCRGEIEVEKGIIVDDFMRTSAENIFACGDVCETKNRISGERGIYANFWNAVRQGRIAALNLLGFEVKYDGSDAVNSLKKLGFHLIIAGELRGDYSEIEERENYYRFYVKDGKLNGYVLVGDISNAGLLFRLMISRYDVSKLADKLHRLKDCEVFGF